MFSFVDEDGESWDPETADESLDWGAEETTGGLVDTVAEDWDSRIDRSYNAGRDDVKEVDRPSDSGEGAKDTEIDRVEDYVN